jgi:hypothetical protein
MGETQLSQKTLVVASHRGGARYLRLALAQGWLIQAGGERSHKRRTTEIRREALLESRTVIAITFTDRKA